jgi:transcriptional regulator GlxA family with amidase domain
MTVPDDADHVPVHEVLIPLFDGVQPLDVVGPHEVLAGAGRLVEHRAGGPGYGVSLVAERPGPVRGHSGLQLVACGPLPDSGPIGTLLVPGGTPVLAMSGAGSSPPRPGCPPGDYVEQVRVDTARRLLESEPVLVAVAAGRAGFGSAETMRRAFLRRLGVPPDHYRRRFAVQN